jgi:hypothetical protein
MFANTQMGGMNFGIPDICLTPMPTPTPIPYPNFSFGPLGVPAVYKVLFMGTPAHNLMTMIPISTGDEPGVLGGIISHTFIGSTRTITGAFRVLVGGLPCQRLTSINIQNTMNCIGMRIVPSQVKVIVLAG